MRRVVAYQWQRLAQVFISCAIALFQFYFKLKVHIEIMKTWFWRSTSKRSQWHQGYLHWQQHYGIHSIFKLRIWLNNCQPCPLTYSNWKFTFWHKLWILNIDSMVFSLEPTTQVHQLWQLNWTCFYFIKNSCSKNIQSQPVQYCQWQMLQLFKLLVLPLRNAVLFKKQTERVS